MEATSGTYFALFALFVSPSAIEAHPQPSHLPYFLNSLNTHSLRSLTSLSPLSLSLPFSVRLPNDDPLSDLGLTPDMALPPGGDPDTPGAPNTGEVVDVGTAWVEGGVVEEGKERRYHPPVYVNAISWYSRVGSWPFPSCCGWLSCESEGIWIHATTHFSSSTTSAVGGLEGGAEMDM